MPTPAPCVWVLAPVSARVCCSGLKSSASPLDSSPHFITCTDFGLHPGKTIQSTERGNKNPCVFPPPRLSFTPTKRWCKHPCGFRLDSGERESTPPGHAPAVRCPSRCLASCGRPARSEERRPWGVRARRRRRGTNETTPFSRPQPHIPGFQTVMFPGLPRVCA